MKKIIDGFRYDTEKAELVGEARSDVGKGDFRWWKEGLYRTPRAHRFFLSGEGGPMSQWAKGLDDGSRTSGEGIRPLTEKDAQRWAEKYLDAETVEKFFDVEDA